MPVPISYPSVNCSTHISTYHYSANGDNLDIFFYSYLFSTAKFSSSGSHGTGQVPDYHIFWIVRQYLQLPKFLQVIFCYCFYIWTVQLRCIPFGYLLSLGFRVMRVLFCVFWSPHNEVTDGVGNRGS